MSKLNYVVDYDKLKHIIVDVKGLTLSDAAVKIGMSKSGLTNIGKSSTMSGQTKVGLETILGIRYEDIKPKNSIDTSTAPQFECKFPDRLEVYISDEQMEQLQIIIGRAVYKAVHTALNEPSMSKEER